MSISRNQSVSRPIARPISPGLIKKVEKEILAEAKSEDKHLKNTVKDLTQVEKAESKARKAINKADSALGKAEKKENKTLKDMYRAEHNHDVAVSNIRKKQQEFEASTKMHAKIKETLQKKSVGIERAIQDHEEHTKIRNEKLAVLRGTADKTAVSEVIADTLNAHGNETARN